MPLAIYNRKTNQVQTIIRDDHGGYRPPDGWELLPVEKLPAGWTPEPADEPIDTQRAEAITEAQRIIDDPQTPLELATWAAMQETIEELRAAKSGKPKPTRTDQELREAAKQRLRQLFDVVVNNGPLITDH